MPGLTPEEQAAFTSPAALVAAFQEQVAAASQVRAVSGDVFVL